MESVKITQTETAGVPYHSKLYEIFSFGHLPVIVDWLWMSALSDPSLVHLPPGIHPQLYYKYLLITELDPAFKDVYEVGGSLLTFARQDNLGAKELLKRGANFFETKLPAYSLDFHRKFWGWTWPLYVTLGYVELFGLKDLPNASEAFRAAARHPGSPSYLASLDKKLSIPGGIYDLGIHSLEFMIKGQADPALVETLNQQRQDLIVGRYLFHLNRDFSEFHKPFPLVDPWGGRLSRYPASKKIVTSTPHQAVWGLE